MIRLQAIDTNGMDVCTRVTIWFHDSNLLAFKISDLDLGLSQREGCEADDRIPVPDLHDPKVGDHGFAWGRPFVRLLLNRETATEKQKQGNANTDKGSFVE